MQDKIYVYENFSSELPQKLGVLFVDAVKGNEHYSFEFEDQWLHAVKTNPVLDPDLLMNKGRQYPVGKNIFGLFSDSSPDRWGRILMQRRERIVADREDRKPRKLNESDYLLGVYDETRMGVIRFKTEEDSVFLSDDKEMAAPPWATLRTLEEASRQFEKEENILEEKWLNQLLKPGSSLGGARPKASVQDTNGELWIAKFPSRKDDYNVGAWEKVAHDLAALCGLDVPESAFETFSKLGGTFLAKRFDRKGEQRIHFASAMTMLGKEDDACAEDGSSYLEIASFLKSNSILPEDDVKELWRRIVFSMAISNTDDHLRNHGFLLTAKGWRLSPLYDVNPVPYGDTLALNVDEINNDLSLSLAIEAAPSYGLSKCGAKRMAEEIQSLVKENWERLALRYGIGRGAVEYMRPAFRACYT